jgi:hypothetical protein
VFLRQAAMIPPTVPMTAESTAETPTSATVGGIAAVISSQTGWRLWYEIPRFSWAVSRT